MTLKARLQKLQLGAMLFSFFGFGCMMNTKNFLYLLCLSCCWGPSFLLIKLGLESFTPCTLVFFRLLIGGLILTVFNLLHQHRLQDYKSSIKEFFLIGLFSNALPFVFITTGELFIQSSLAAIMNSTTPLFTTIIAHFFLQDEKLKYHKVLGVLLGMIGIIIIFYPSLEKMNFNDALGCIFVLLGALSYSISFVLTKKRPHAVPLTLFPAGQLLAASILVFPFAAYSFPEMKPLTLSSGLALMSLSCIGTALAFILYFYLVKNCGATFVSYSSLLFPVIGMVLGVSFLGETLQKTIYIGSVTIFLGVLLACFYEPIKEKLLFEKNPTLE